MFVCNGKEFLAFVARPYLRVTNFLVFHFFIFTATEADRFALVQLSCSHHLRSADKLKQQFESARAGLKSTQAELKGVKSAASLAEADLKENIEHLGEELKEAKAEISELLKVLSLL